MLAEATAAILMGPLLDATDREFGNSRRCAPDVVVRDAHHFSTKAPAVMPGLIAPQSVTGID
jgi:hypothetical protein